MSPERLAHLHLLAEQAWNAMDPVVRARIDREVRESLGCCFKSYDIPLGPHYPGVRYPGVCEGGIVCRVEAVADYGPMNYLIGPMRQPQYSRKETCGCTGCGQEFLPEDFREEIKVALLKMDTLAAQAAESEQG